MDSSRFDRLTRLFATAASRRALGGAALGALAGVLAPGEADGMAAPCPTGKQRCRGRCIPKRHCCTAADCPKHSGMSCRTSRC